MNSFYQVLVFTRKEIEECTCTKTQLTCVAHQTLGDPSCVLASILRSSKLALAQIVSSVFAVEGKSWFSRHQ